jgi:hypothetical protein
MHSRVCVAGSIQYGNKAERPEPPGNGRRRVHALLLEFYDVLGAGFFAPSNPHDLHVQLQTAVDILGLLTCPKTVAAA